ncbi:MAG: MoaD/ThiS family protein [Gammaproteobacteria bacterium]
MITLHIEFFAALREQSGLSQKSIDSESTDAAQVYSELAKEHGFTLTPADLKLAVNDEFADWSRTLCDGDRLVFIPPVSGG